MITLASSETCTGCMACAQVCPLSCIQICKDSAGNHYPKIDLSRCISCGKCNKSCPVLNPVVFQKPIRAYAVWSLNKLDRVSSASGGAASVFYQTALKTGSWICGCEYTDDFRVVHTICNTADAINRYKQSKYVFSDSSDIYQQIQKHLKQGNHVLFISLPCKIAGLLKYLGKKYDNLITVDIVCHGTPSADRLKNHIQSVLNGKSADQLVFRNENEFAFTLKFQAEKVYQKTGRQDSYLAAFLEGIGYRPSCYRCQFARPERVSDLTICDFWGLGHEIPWKHPYTGSVSAVMVHTDAGQHFFENCKPHLFWEERPVEEVIQGNAQMKHPTPIHPQADCFEKLCLEVGFEKAVNIFLKDVISADRKQLMQNRFRIILRKIAGIFIKRYRG